MLQALCALMHYVFTDSGCERFLEDELRRARPHGHSEPFDSGMITDAPLDTPWVFCRQALPDAAEVRAESINALAGRIVDAAITQLPRGQPWRMDIQPDYGEGSAGQNRCRLIGEAVRQHLQKKQRSVLRSLIECGKAWTADDSLIQMRLLAPDHAILSAAIAPTPFVSRFNVWPFPKGRIPVAEDKQAPSRAFAKLVEACLRLGREIKPGETCVDLGAAPGSWSYVAVHRGASVTAIDRSDLRDDLMKHSRVRFVRGDAFKFRPDAPVDWLLCDVIAAPERNIATLSEWLAAGLMRQFVVSIKFIGDAHYAVLDALKPVLARHCSHHLLTRLCANKNEVCAAGIVH